MGTKPKKFNSYSKNYWLYVLAFTLLLVAVVFKRQQFISGLKELLDASPAWVAVAIVSLIFTYISTTAIYLIIAKKPISAKKTFFVQVASSFINRLIPSGIGGIGLNVDFLMKSKHSAPEASSVVAVNGLVAFISHILMIIVAIISGLGTNKLTFKIDANYYWAIILAIVVLLISLQFVLLKKTIKSKIRRFVHSTIKDIKAYEKSPSKIVMGVLLASCVTIFFVFALFASAQAVGLHISLTQAFIAYTLGVFIGAATLTPGGLGGAELGMYAGLVAYGVGETLAFSTVILFRLIVFWIPIIPGYLSFIFLRKNRTI
jgi:uncharacterized membrane protein YbhN (UPF0104 family)